MANGVNKVILLGNLGKDPEVHNFENGVKKVTFSLATTETYKNKDGQRVSQTEWHNIVVWRGLAETVEKYLKKGDTIYLEGKIKNRDYEVNGVKKYITEILVDNMTMIGTRRDQPQNPSSENHAQEPVQESYDFNQGPADKDNPPF
jgi:single-strand DNA-binding protein